MTEVTKVADSFLSVSTLSTRPLYFYSTSCLHLLQIFHNWPKGVFNHIYTTLATYGVVSGTCPPPPHVVLVMVLDMGAWEPITIAKMRLLRRIYGVKWDKRG